MLYETLYDPIVIDYPIKISTQISFLKKLITAMETSSSEIHDELYQALVRLKCITETEEFTFKHILVEKEHIIIKEAVNMISNGTTGLHTWEAAIYLIDYLYNDNNRKYKLYEKTIVELGAGTGFLGILLHKLMKPQYMLLTDCHFSVLQLLQENLKINQCPSHRISVQRFCWGIENFDLKLTNIDLLIASDVVYDEDIFVLLLETVQEIFKINPECHFILAATVRNEKTLNKFIELVKTKKLLIQEINYKINHFSYLLNTNTHVKIFIINFLKKT